MMEWSRDPVTMVLASVSVVAMLVTQLEWPFSSPRSTMFSPILTKNML